MYYGACAITAIYEVTALAHLGMFAYLSAVSISELTFALCAGAVGNNKAALVHTVLAVLCIGGAMWELGLSGVISVTGPKGTVEVDIREKANKGGNESKLQEVLDVADNYALSDDTFNNHILDRHGFDSTYGNKSHFNADFNIMEGIDSTLKGDNFTVTSNTGGRKGYIFEQTFTNPIGSNSKGKPLYTIKVVIDDNGNVITAFPKK